ncbi:MAG: L,D-transpeptidase family protein [Deltaproteobacteria bacterium]|nr:L,D-transpeptidase family protein [Deltaproteobacteria bacterium]MBW2674094.1 L,D-transpeptidase family protein [Deltaproteobacteria bacterium]
MKRQNMFWRGPRSVVLFLSLIFLSISAMTPIPGFGSGTTDETMSFIPDSLVSLAAGHAIVVDKTMQRLFVYRFDGTSFQRTYETVCSTGKNKGTKIRSGDARTPEGVYFPIKFFSDEELGAIYGSMAFDLNYPNILDKKEKNNGNNIWLHGTDKPLTPHQSNGCITLENDDIDAISRFITLNETPIIIQDYIKWVSPLVQIAQRESIMPFISDWASTVCDGSVRKLTELYGKNSRYDRKGRDRLASQIQTLKKYGGGVTLVPQDLSLLKHDKYTVAMFRQGFTVNGHPYDAGLRKLFLKKWRNDWYIEGDVTVTPGKESQFIAELEKTNNDYANRNDIRKIVDTWVASWETGDMKGYASFYAEDFRSKGMNHDSWLAYKSNLLRLNKNIHIDVKNFKVTHQSRHKVTVAFEQRYHSSRVNDVGIKTLSLKNVDNSWKICKETWRSKR